MKTQRREFMCQGFSLVETLVAITILLLVIIGPLTISSSSVRSTAFASEQVAAFFLAQEGAELMQKGRDDFLLEHFRDTNPDPTVFASANPDPWTDFRTGVAYSPCYDAGGCGVSMSSTGEVSVRSCSSQTCLLYLDTSAGQVRSRYTYTNTSSPTIFTRTVKLTRVSAAEVNVVSTVTWQSGFSKDQQRVVVQTSLFNIYDTN